MGGGLWRELGIEPAGGPAAGEGARPPGAFWGLGGFVCLVFDKEVGGFSWRIVDKAERKVSRVNPRAAGFVAELARERRGIGDLM